MHDAWKIDDVARLLIKHCNKHSLTQLAQTCHFMSELAATRIWANITDPRALTSCFPQHYYQQALTAQDCERFRSRTVHTREVRFEKRQDLSSWYHFDNVTPWSMLCEELRASRDSNETWPGLSRLKLIDCSSDLLLPFIGICGKQLSRLNLQMTSIRSKDDTMKRFLSSLGELPELSCLKLRSNDLEALPWSVLGAPKLSHVQLKAHIWATEYIEYPPTMMSSTAKEELKRYHDLTSSFDLARAYDIVDMLPGTRPQPQIEKKPDLMPDMISIHALCAALVVCLSQSWWLPTEEVSAMFHRGPRVKEVLEEYVGHELPAYHSMVEQTRSSDAMDRALDIAMILASKCYHLDYPDPQAPSWIAAANAFRNSLAMIRPMHSLRILSFSEIPDFIKYGDELLNASIAKNFPSLETLSILTAWDRSEEADDQPANNLNAFSFDHNRTHIKNVALFCSKLPSLRNIHMDCIHATSYGDTRVELACSCGGVEQLHILFVTQPLGHQVYNNWDRDTFWLDVQAYFPNSDLAKGKYPVETIYFSGEPVRSYLPQSLRAS